VTAEVELEDELPTAVYRLYSDETLIYVGVTNSLKTRFAWHAKHSSWWPQVTRKTVVWYGERYKALDAEAIAIRDEHPGHNAVDPIALADALPSQARGRGSGRNKTPLIGWHSADPSLKPWIEAESERRGITIRELLDEALAEYRADPVFRAA